MSCRLLFSVPKEDFIKLNMPSKPSSSQIWLVWLSKAIVLLLLSLRKKSRINLSMLPLWLISIRLLLLSGWWFVEKKEMARLGYKVLELRLLSFLRKMGLRLLGIFWLSRLLILLSCTPRNLLVEPMRPSWFFSLLIKRKEASCLRLIPQVILQGILLLPRGLRIKMLRLT